MSQSHRYGGPSWLRRLAALAFVSAVFLPAASAQDARQMFEEGMRAFRNGDRETALSVFRQVVRMDPANLQAHQWVIYSQDDLLDLMVAEGEFQTFAAHLLEAAGTERRAAMRDVTAAAQAAEGALSGSYSDRAKARFELLTRFGPFAAPPLISALGAGGGEERRLAAIYALSRMGTEMTVPLLLASYADQPDVRAGVVLALGNLHDARADARLADVAENDPDTVVRTLAAGLAPSGDPAELYFQQGMAFYAGDPERGLTGAENHGVMWRLQGSRLDPVDVPPSLVPLELAKHQFLEAARHGNDRGLAGAALAYGAELATLRDRLAAGENELGEAFDRLHTAALSLPQVHLNQGLQMAMERGEPSTATMLAELLDGPGLSDFGVLQDAVVSRFPNVRYSAAVTLANAGDSSSEVVRALGDAAGLQALRVVHVMDANAARRQSLAAGLEAEGIVVVQAPDGAGGLANLWRGFGADLFVIADPLPDFYARRVVREIRRDPRYAETPALILANADTGSIEGARNFDALDAPAVLAALPPLDGERRMSLEVAAAAARALSALALRDPSSVSEVAGALQAAAGREEDDIAAPAIDALGHAGDPGAWETLIGIVGNAERGSAVRAAAANALAAMLNRSGWAPPDTSVLEAGYQGDDPVLRKACARALAAAGAHHTPAWMALGTEG